MKKFWNLEHFRFQIFKLGILKPVKCVQAVQQSGKKSEIERVSDSKHIGLLTQPAGRRNPKEKLVLGMMAPYTKGLLLPLQKVLQNCRHLMVSGLLLFLRMQTDFLRES